MSITPTQSSDTKEAIKLNLSLATTKLPGYFYDISNPIRWFDPFANKEDGEDRIILTPREQFDKLERNQEYSAWLRRFDLKQRLMKFQRVRIVKDQYAESTQWDWWKDFQDAIVTVFINPENMYYKKDFMQFYVVCPEDCELISRNLLYKKHGNLPPRKAKWIAEDPRLKIAYVVPCRCCSQIRNETKAGKLEWQEHL